MITKQVHVVREKFIEEPERFSVPAAATQISRYHGLREESVLVVSTEFRFSLFKCLLADLQGLLKVTLKSKIDS